jgi:hypothetical protein
MMAAKDSKEKKAVVKAHVDETAKENLKKVAEIIDIHSKEYVAKKKAEKEDF